MGADSKIQWTHHTFNPWVGCQRVSPGCVNCYAEAYDKRVGGVPKKQRTVEGAQLRWGPTAPRTRTSAANWREPFRWDLAAKAAGERHRVFCASLADVFEDRPELVPWRLDLFRLIAQTANLDWLLLTKRPENIEPLWPEKRFGPNAKHWPNVWLGTTVEDQQRANERIPHLVAVPAAVRFLSCEPLLEALNLDPWLDEDHLGFINSPIDWVIIGGESGPGARPFNLAWARALVWQCRNGGRSVEPTPFVKQLGSQPKRVDENGEHFWLTLADRHGGDMAEWPEDLRVREFPEVSRG